MAEYTNNSIEVKYKIAKKIKITIKSKVQICFYKLYQEEQINDCFYLRLDLQRVTNQKEALRSVDDKLLDKKTIN